jgi:photosystem II stability/assembly factor-like uncharacterized protein
MCAASATQTAVLADGLGFLGASRAIAPANFSQISDGLQNYAFGCADWAADGVTGFAAGSYTPYGSPYAVLVKSVDGGATWNDVAVAGAGFDFSSPTMQGYTFTSVTILSPTRVLLVALPTYSSQSTMLVVSSDGGVSWANPLSIPSGGGSTRYIGPVCAYGTLSCIAGYSTGGQFELTSDGGATWTGIAHGLGADFLPQAFAFAGPAAGSLVVCSGSGTGNNPGVGCAASSDGGNTWKGPAKPLGYVAFYSIVFPALARFKPSEEPAGRAGEPEPDPCFGYAAGFWPLPWAITTDCGVTWTNASSSSNSTGSSLVPWLGFTTNLVFATSQLGALSVSQPLNQSIQPRVWITTDGGTSFVPVTGSLPYDVTIAAVTASALVPVSPAAYVSFGRGALAAYGGLVLGYSATNASQPVRDLRRYVRQPAAAAGFGSALVGGVVYQDGTLLKTTDGGNTWAIRAGVRNYVANGMDTLVSLSVPTPSDWYALLRSCTLLSSTDGGVTWTSSAALANASTPPMGGQPQPVGIQMWNATFGYAMTTYWLLVTRDGAATWSQLPALPSPTRINSQQYLGFAIAGSPNAIVALAGAAGNVSVSLDGGVSFTSVLYDSYLQVNYMMIVAMTDKTYSVNIVKSQSVGVVATSVSFSDPSGGWMVGTGPGSPFPPAFVGFTADQGLTWKVTGTPGLQLSVVVGYSDVLAFTCCLSTVKQPGTVTRAADGSLSVAPLTGDGGIASGLVLAAVRAPIPSTTPSPSLSSTSTPSNTPTPSTTGSAKATSSPGATPTRSRSVPPLRSASPSGSSSAAVSSFLSRSSYLIALAAMITICLVW